MIEQVVHVIGYRSYLEKKYKAEFESRWANVEGTRGVRGGSTSRGTDG